MKIKWRRKAILHPDKYWTIMLKEIREENTFKHVLNRLQEREKKKKLVKAVKAVPIKEFIACRKSISLKVLSSHKIDIYALLTQHNPRFYHDKIYTFYIKKIVSKFISLYPNDVALSR